MKRTSMQALYVGDIGVIVAPSVPKSVPKDIDIDSLSLLEMMTLALECGANIKDLIGIDNCYEHVGMIAIHDRALPAGYSLLLDCKYCTNCFIMFRTKRRGKL